MASNCDTDACCKSSPVTEYYGEKTGRGLIRIAQTKECATYEPAFASTSSDPVPLKNLGDLSYACPTPRAKKTGNSRGLVKIAQPARSEARILPYM